MIEPHHRRALTQVEDSDHAFIVIPAHSTPAIDFAQKRITVDEGSTELITITGRGLQSAVTVTVVVEKQSTESVGIAHSDARLLALSTKLNVVLPAGDGQARIVVAAPDDDKTERAMAYGIGLRWLLDGFPARLKP